MNKARMNEKRSFMKKAKRTIMGTDDNIFKFNSAFFAEYENLGILEKGLKRKCKLPIWQYANYLSRIAFCIELGMKTIIIFKGSVDEIHCLDELYKLMPDVFREMVEKKTGGQIEIIEKLESIKKIFVEFRYMETHNLPFFVEESILKKGYIIFSKIKNIQNFRFVRILLEEIMGYYKYLYNNIDRNKFSSMNWETDSDQILKIYFDELKRVQSLSYVANKDN
jgi:hypothetical protein